MEIWPPCLPNVTQLRCFCHRLLESSSGLAMMELWMRMKRGRCARKSSRSRERRLRSSRLTSSSCSSWIPPAFSSTSSCSALIQPCGASVASDWPSSRNRNNCCKTRAQVMWLNTMPFSARAFDHLEFILLQVHQQSQFSNLIHVKLFIYFLQLWKCILCINEPIMKPYITVSIRTGSFRVENSY